VPKQTETSLMRFEVVLRSVRMINLNEELNEERIGAKEK
jgi:hypothetical protein